MYRLVPGHTKKGTLLQLPSNVTLSKIIIFDHLKNPNNRAVSMVLLDLKRLRYGTFFVSPGR